MSWDDYKKPIPSNIVDEKGFTCRCGAAPEPTTCEYCGKTLYHCGFTIPSYSRKNETIVISWTDEPERCDCPDAVKHWQEHDAEVERKRLEEEAIAERARHKAKVEKLLSKSGIRKRYQQRTFDRFVQDTPGRKRAYKIARDYAESFDKARENGEGLYIEGTYGTGKTHLAAAIALYLTEKEYSVVMKTSFDLFEEIKSTFDDSERTEHQVIKAYKECDLLVIDDLGKEQCTDWSMSVLYAIVNERYEAMRPMIITTNFGSDDLIRVMTPKGFGSQKIEAIISRLREVSRPIPMVWNDFRSE